MALVAPGWPEPAGFLTMIAYRDATLDDALAIDALFRQGFIDTFAHLYDPKDLAAFFAGFTQAAWRARDRRSRLRLPPRRGGRRARRLSPKSPRSRCRSSPPGRRSELRQLYVLKAPGTAAGIAPVLMDWVLAEARRRGAEELYLSVFTDNHRAKSFYARYGFEAVGPYIFMVGNHADEDIIMRLKL